MELRHLRYFVALAEELHFARAADRLNIAPSTLTVQIQEIERRLSARLLERTKRSVSLTPAGEIFLAEARNVLAQYARAENIGRRAGRGEIGLVGIGYVGSAAYAGVLQDQTRRFRRTFPDIHIEAREYAMGDLPGLVADGHVDIGFLRLPMALPRALQMHVLAQGDFCLAIPGDHHLAGETGPVRSDRLADEIFIAPEQPVGIHEVARRGGFAARISSRPGSLAAVLTQISLGMGISILPKVVRGVVHMPNVSFRPLEGPPIISQIAAIFRAGENDAAVNNLIDQIARGDRPAPCSSPDG